MKKIIVFVAVILMSGVSVADPCRELDWFQCQESDQYCSYHPEGFSDGGCIFEEDRFYLEFDIDGHKTAKTKKAYKSICQMVQNLYLGNSLSKTSSQELCGARNFASCRWKEPIFKPEQCRIKSSIKACIGY